MDNIEILKRELTEAVANAADEAALEAIRVAALGKKGRISQLMKGLGQMSPEERKEQGPVLNALKNDIADTITARAHALHDAALATRLATEKIDVTLPVRPEPAGSIHPVTQVIDEVVAIFADMDFSVAVGPDIETDFYNFTALNIPPEHPARQMHDTFYFHEKADGERPVLRTHTSPVQIRSMQAH